jgi:cation transport ATPase
MTSATATQPGQPNLAGRGGWRTSATIPIASAITGLSCGTAAYLLDRPDIATLAWTLGVVPVLAVLAWEIVSSLIRGDVGLDLVAALAMAAALSIGEFLAAAVVALMYAGGQALEAFATAPRGRPPATTARRFRPSRSQTSPSATVSWCGSAM